MARKQQLLHKYLARKCTQAELEELFQHLREKPNDRAHDEVAQEVWQELYPTDALSSQESEALFQQIRTRIPRKTFPVWRVAAGLTGALIGFALVYYLLVGGQITQTADYGETRTVVLPDQSTVVLNANSSIRYARRWAEDKPREVQLSGEAYFSVQHLANHQSFTVYTENLAVAVLGTEFNVQNRRGNTQVTLNTGKIRLSALGDAPVEVAGLIMQPGEQATLTHDQTFALTTVAPDPVIAWTAHELVFEEASLEEVAQTIEDLYGRPVIIENDSIRQLKLTGTLPNNDISTLLGLLSTIFDIQATEENEQIYLR